MDQTLSSKSRCADALAPQVSAASPQPGDALLLVDMQRDFLPGGSLAVPQGADILPHVKAWIERFRRAGLPIYASRDWHPPHHFSFHEQGGPWPIHCVAGTPGAAFAKDLQLPTATIVVSKGQAQDAEAYSAFEGTELEQSLRQQAVRRLCVAGLALEYCVLNSVLDALQRGFAVRLLSAAVAALNVQPGDAEQALQKMRDAGAQIDVER
ncbi:isochorismatase family protein [Roseateles oligotrophus]|uniref:nicotinamidase n=1 Tax=Roseateles oligotrophus TaxID=1769250 RepID=A0ABT2YF95_9BURK|nr:isochorismatase family protein [Roseateles oligotrophus]MCV2368694.1 isochorismatase family protein [Roseateles oligotrophus]